MSIHLPEEHGRDLRTKLKSPLMRCFWITGQGASTILWDHVSKVHESHPQTNTFEIVSALLKCNFKPLYCDNVFL